MRSLTLLGPQRLTPTLPEAVAAVGVDLSPGQPPLATVTAGWQEREDEDADLVAALLGNTVNLRLYARVADIFERDPDLARAHRERGQRLRDIQTLYELRLGHAMDARLRAPAADDRRLAARRRGRLRARGRARPRRSGCWRSTPR